MSIAGALGIIAAGAGVGVFSALFGVGGGIVMVPFITLVLDKGQHLAEGTSLLVIVPTAVVGVVAHRKAGYSSFRLAAMLAVGGIVGSLAGALIALEISGDSLRKVFGVFVAIMGVRLINDGLRSRRGSDVGPTA